jgi:ABC-type transport system substrate-binding protein
MKKMKTILSVLLILAMALTMAACTKTETPPNAETPAVTPGGGEPAAAPSGDEDEWVSVTLGVTGTLGRFLAGIAPTESPIACDGVFDTIFRANPKTKEIESTILEDWHYEDDVTLIVKLKDNVYFSNGDKVTAEDVVFSYLCHFERGSNFLNTMGLIQDECVVIDELTAQFKFEKPYGSFFTFAVYLVDKAWSQQVGWDSEEWYKPVGSGPYECVEYVFDDHITLHARDDYWNADAGDIYVDEWIVKYYPDPSTMYMDLEIGNIALCQVSSPDYSRYLKSGGTDFECMLISTGVTEDFYFGYESVAAWKDKNLRQAIAYGVNWEELAILALGDMYIPTNSIAPAISPLYLDPGKYEYNPEKAKELLAAAGYAPGELKLKTFMMDVPIYKALCEGFQFYCSEIGVDVTVEYGDIPSAVAVWGTPGGCDFGFLWTLSGSPTYDPYRSISSADGSSTKWSWVDDEKFQELFQTVAYTIDPEVKKAASYEIQQYIHDEVLLIPYAAEASAIGYSTKLFTREQMENFVLLSDSYHISSLGLASAWK